MDDLKAKKRKAATAKYITFFCAIIVIILAFSIVIFIASKGIQIFTKNKVSLVEFLFSSKWDPDADAPKLGALIFIAGSLIVSLFAIAVSAPLSIGVAIFIVKIAPKWGYKYLQPVIELFAGIPSVVYGWIGLTVLVPFIRKYIGGLGYSLLAGGIVLAIMMMPTIASVSTDSLKALPSELYEGSLALGATRWQSIYHILLPAASPGILSAIVLGFARGLGEALAVQMVIGNVFQIPHSLTDAMHTMTSIITMDMGNTVQGSLHNNALWSIALLLLIISFCFILLIRLIGKKEVYK